jgi:hypothetical protein
MAIAWVSEAPGALENVPESLAKEMAFSWASHDWRIRSSTEKKRELFFRKLVTATGSSDQRGYVSLSDLLCRKEYCDVEHDGKPLYADNSHMTTSGAAFASSVFEPLFSSLSPR